MHLCSVFLLITAACFTFVIAHFKISNFVISKTSKQEKKRWWFSHFKAGEQHRSVQWQLKANQGHFTQLCFWLTATSGRLHEHSGSQFLLLWSGRTELNNNPFQRWLSVSLQENCRQSFGNRNWLPASFSMNTNLPRIWSRVPDSPWGNAQPRTQEEIPPEGIWENCWTHTATAQKLLRSPFIKQGLFPNFIGRGINPCLGYVEMQK